MERPGITYQNATDLVCNLPKTEVDRYASQVASILRFEPGADIFGLIAKIGGRLHVEDIFSRPADIDTIFVHGVRDFDIVLSSISSPRRDRFTIAHELGHYFLHSLQGQRPLRAARNGSNRAEWEANWFAAGFLMPRDMIASDIQTISIPEMAIKYGVSQVAISIRMKSFSAQ